MSNVVMFLFLLMILTFVGIIKYLEKNLPKKEKRLKKEWEKEFLAKQLKSKIKYQAEIEKKIKVAQKRGIIQEPGVIKEIGEVQKESKKLSHEEKKEKGELYEKYVANYFRNEGYYVWEHGEEKGRRDGGIDLFIKKGNETFFVQCKNWENWKISQNTVQAVQTKIRNYMQENPNLTKLLNGKNKKILYVMPKPILTKAAYAYIKNNHEILDFKIIPIKEV
ncbi:MAG: restriction endonuclease [Sulfurimonadaceae bacterium]|jgi:Holliday junction resolvase-like predicted endonuclease